jgi:hypothetical protein
MATINDALEATARALKIQHALRAKAVRRMRARHEGQEKAERQIEARRKEADKLRSAGKTDAAHNRDEAVLKLQIKAEREKHRAIREKQRAKRKAQLIHKLDLRKETLEKKLAAMQPHVGKDGKVAGAKDKGEAAVFAARFAAARCADASRPNFYSMTGSGFNVQHPILKKDQPHIGQLEGQRSDCSLFVTEVCWAAKLPDPNGEHWKAGYTGTLLGQHNGWKIVSEAAMRKHGWGIIVYLRWPGDTVGHHTEFFVGGNETIGHGSAPVDPGVVDLFGDHNYVCLIHEA